MRVPPKISYKKEEAKVVEYRNKKNEELFFGFIWVPKKTIYIFIYSYSSSKVEYIVN